MAETPVPRGNKNWLLVKFRQWHSWGGVFLSVFILVVAVTGIILNHKDFFLKGEKKQGPSGSLTSTTDFAALPVSFPRALELARGHFGDVPLEKIELKDEHGQLMYKVSRGEGEEIRIDAGTGEMTTKYGMSLTETGKTTLNWGKIIDDLHTGKILGLFGKLTVDFTSGVIIALTLTGIYLWGMPMILKRRNALRRQATATRPMPRSPLVHERTPVEVQ
jgi:hypothetical protein